MSSECLSNKGRFTLRIFYDGFFSALIAPNTIEVAACLSNEKLAFFKSYQIPSAFWNALFEFHRSICDQTIKNQYY
jgi:hypothetical protein